MSRNPDSPILSSEFTNTLLLTAAEEVDIFRQDHPDYRTFVEQRTQWNDTLSQLDSALLLEYDSQVHRAFIDYQEILENYFIVKGLAEAFGGHRTELGGEEAPVPGLREAERRLQQACRHFVQRLDETAGAQCAEYLRVRKRIVDTGRTLCLRCGAELAAALLKQSGLAPMTP